MSRLNWEVLTNNGTIITAQNRITKATFSGTSADYNAVLAAADVVEEPSSGGGVTAPVEVTASRNVTAADNGKILACNSATAITLTIPTGLGPKFSFSFEQVGLGQVTITAPTPANIKNALGHNKTVGQFAMGSILPTLTPDVYILAGQTTA